MGVKPLAVIITIGHVMKSVLKFWDCSCLIGCIKWDNKKVEF